MSTAAVVAVTAASTLGAAALTALFAYSSARQRIAAETAHLAIRFDQERQLHDVSELRAILDHSADVIRGVRKRVRDPEQSEWVQASLDDLEPLHSQLSVRLGQDHPLTENLDATLAALERLDAHYDAVTLFRTEEEEDGFMDVVEELRDEILYTAGTFLDEAHEIVGARLSVAAARS